MMEEESRAEIRVRALAAEMRDWTRRQLARYEGKATLEVFQAVRDHEAAEAIADLLHEMHTDLQRREVHEAKTLRFDLEALSEAGEFLGLAAAYSVVDDQGDQISPGAFDASLARRSSVPLLFQHDPNQILGVGELVDTPTGLKIRGRLNLAVARSKEIYALLRQGALKGLSIGYVTIRSDWRGKVRILREIALHEVSLTAFPAQQLALVERVKSSIGEERVWARSVVIKPAR